MRRHAARNNAEWCDIVCRSHEIATRFDGDAWTSPTRTPQFYPDAVTLTPDVAAPDLLARIDAAAGCSVKDSFAALDLSPHGFRVLFDAEWIVRAGAAPAAPRSGSRWEPVRDRRDFARWKVAWSDGDGATDVLRDELLDNRSVMIAAARAGDRIVAGAILNRSARVVGISNFFTTTAADGDGGDDLALARWLGLLALVAARFPGLPVVGYESGEQLALARASGFEAAGPLRVWIRDG